MSKHAGHGEIVRMANEIATFFSAYPRDEAVRETAYHISHFWDPRMREHLRTCIASGGAELSPLALEAGRIVSSQTNPKTVTPAKAGVP